MKEALRPLWKTFSKLLNLLALHFIIMKLLNKIPTKYTKALFLIVSGVVCAAGEPWGWGEFDGTSLNKNQLLKSFPIQILPQNTYFP